MKSMLIDTDVVAFVDSKATVIVSMVQTEPSIDVESLTV